MEVAGVVEGAADAVDPAEAECLIACFGIGDARAAGFLLVEADDEFGGLGVVLLSQARKACSDRKKLASMSVNLSWGLTL